MNPQPENAPREALDSAFSQLAIDEALKSPGNARVGVVVVRDGQVVAAGHRDEVPGLHAEQVALQKVSKAGIALRGAEVYTTLEPCANSRTARIPCAQLLVEAGVATVHIGQFDRNPQVNRLGWKYLRDAGVALRDFPANLRAIAAKANQDFAQNFTHGLGMSGGAKFDFTTNGGKFTISLDEEPDSPTWETRWGNCGATAIYLNGGSPGRVALARYAGKFDEIDDPDALDYESHFAKVPIGSIGVMRSPRGHALCRVKKIEPTPDYGGTGHVSVTIDWEIRLAVSL
ncbi:deaminase [Gordonia sp. HY002]|uniref:deaminase n=1 Tax=Gordonia zhenghanii TaxID=2911516 RepID=UPI001EF0BD23|nr:deaminase [Gordonia zhenghanii]MCF8571074.1 deaminase [Gordonia zhenghanii]MCF8606235.1 deaminase [Gordonia zhenghanii]